jgi:hypothetical protein
VWRGRWRSWSCGHRCSCWNARPWTRCAVRRHGSPHRQTNTDQSSGLVCLAALNFRNR